MGTEEKARNRGNQGTGEVGQSVIRFGVVAVGKGYMTVDQLSEAMKVQLREGVKRKSHRLIGEISVSMGYLNPTQVDEVLGEMEVLFNRS
jgi:hypothetical protein